MPAPAPPQIQEIFLTPENLVLCTHRAEFGIWTTVFSEAGLTGLFFPGSPVAALKAQSGQRIDPGSAEGAVPGFRSEWADKAGQWIEAVLAGGDDRHCRVPLDLRKGTDFQRQIWDILCGIPFGEAMTYRDIAVKCGRPGASRAVGNACGRNPVPLIIPCHRVLPTNGGLGGFSAGLEWKSRLLDRECPTLFSHQ